MKQVEVNELVAKKAGENVIAMAAKLGQIKHAYTCASCNNDCDGAWVRVKGDKYRHYVIAGGVLIEEGGEDCIPF